MLSIPANVSVYLCTGATDLGKGFNGLHTLVLQVFKRDPLDGHLFLFVNRRRDRLKILWWDRDGMALFYKRLAAGTYQPPASPDDCVRLLGDRELALRETYAPESAPEGSTGAHGKQP